MRTMHGFPTHQPGSVPTMGDTTGVTVDNVFAGCTSETEIAVYMGKVAFNWGLRGFVAGAAIGGLGAVAAIWFLSKAKG